MVEVVAVSQTQDSPESRPGIDAAFRELDRSRRIGWARAYEAERKAAEAAPSPSVAIRSWPGNPVIIQVTGWGEGLQSVEIYLSKSELLHLSDTLERHANHLSDDGDQAWKTTLRWPGE